MLCYSKALQSCDMSRKIPYLQRRGDTFGFRMAVPPDLLPCIGQRELTRTLSTGDRELAVQRALTMAAQCKLIFYKLRDMAKKYPDIPPVEFTVSIDLKNLIVTGTSEPHEQEEFVAAMDRAQDKLADFIHRTPSPIHLVSDAPSSLMLFDVVDEFLRAYPKDKKSMLQKHVSCLDGFKDVVGNMPINRFKRSHVKECLEVLQKLPPGWAYIRKRTGATLKEIAAQDYPSLIAKKTFEQTYKTSVSQFLKWARESYSEVGFQEISIEQIKYTGVRVKSELKQRAFTAVELKRLFEGPEMRAFSADAAELHQYWMPLVGLYTGARVNEICQVNPQIDFRMEEPSGIYYLHFTEDSEGDSGITKSVKNIQSDRQVPIHSRLIDLGFLDYLKKVKANGATLLFPKWKPSKGKASTLPAKWFVGFLTEIGLRDETHGQALLGMHAFRHTFSNAAKNAGVDESEIVGHSAGESKVAAGYRGKMCLSKTQVIIEKIQYDLDLARPVEI